MSLKAEVDVWTTTRPANLSDAKRADIWQLIPGRTMSVQFLNGTGEAPQDSEYSYLGHRLHIREGEYLCKTRLAIELPGELVPSIPAYFWLEGDGLKIAIGRTVLAIDLKDD